MSSDYNNNSSNHNHSIRNTCAFFNTSDDYKSYCNSTNHNRNGFYINSGNIKHNITCAFNDRADHYKIYCNFLNHNRKEFYNVSGNTKHNITSSFNHRADHYKIV
ncbi:Uncharacterized protein DAT39_001985, partial [Clarias magur]